MENVTSERRARREGGLNAGTVASESGRSSMGSLEAGSRRWEVRSKQHLEVERKGRLWWGKGHLRTSGGWQIPRLQQWRTRGPQRSWFFYWEVGVGPAVGSVQEEA